MSERSRLSVTRPCFAIPSTKKSRSCQRMRSAQSLLLVFIWALANAADTSTDEKVPTLTLSPEANFLINTRDDSTSSLPVGNSNAASRDTTAPASESIATIPSTTSSTMDTTSGEQSTADPPSSASPTKVSDLPLGRDTIDSASQIETGPTTASSSESSTASVDTLNDSDGELSQGKKSSVGIILPTIFGALACVGAIVIAITYKKKRDGSGGENDSNLPRGYTDQTVLTPNNRALSAVQEDSMSTAMKMSDLCHVDIRPPSTNVSSDTLSPFGSARCKGRVSSPVSCYQVSSESTTEFPDICTRHLEGSNVVLTFEEVPNMQSSVPQVQL